MLYTHGSRMRSFRWYYDPERDMLVIESESKMRHEYPVPELEQIFRYLHAHFGSSSFPLANNVQKLGNGTEILGLGMAILEQKPRDITHAQGSSYLGVVLEDIGYLEWNGKRKGIKWEIIDDDFDGGSIRSRLSAGRGQKKQLMKLRKIRAGNMQRSLV